MVPPIRSFSIMFEVRSSCLWFSKMGAQVLKDMMQASLVDMSAQLTRSLHTAVTICRCWICMTLYIFLCHLLADRQLGPRPGGSMHAYLLTQQSVHVPYASTHTVRTCTSHRITIHKERAVRTCTYSSLLRISSIDRSALKTGG
jgi:hypothetical protein